MTLPLPQGAEKLLGLRLANRTPTSPIIVSFVGVTGLGNYHLFAKSGIEYDWSCADGLPVQIRTRHGIDAGPAMTALYKQWEALENPNISYPAIIDMTVMEAAFLTGRDHAVWPIKRGSSIWHDFFDA